jgi:hypothetical protein
MIDPDDIELVMTSEGCPEQYDAVYRGRVIGFLYLRHGTFFVEYPCPGGTEVYRAKPEGDGAFEWQERDFFLTEAKKALAPHIWPEAEDLE